MTRSSKTATKVTHIGKKRGSRKRNLSAEGAYIVDEGTPTQAMHFLADTYCEAPEEMDSTHEIQVWALIPATLCGQLVEMALKRVPARWEEDKTLAQIVHLRTQTDPDAAGWELFAVPNAEEHLAAILGEEALHAFEEPEELLPDFQDQFEDGETEEDDHELTLLEESGLDNNVLPFPRRPRPVLVHPPRTA